MIWLSLFSARAGGLPFALLACALSFFDVQVANVAFSARGGIAIYLLGAAFIADCRSGARLICMRDTWPNARRAYDRLASPPGAERPFGLLVCRFVCHRAAHSRTLPQPETSQLKTVISWPKTVTPTISCREPAASYPVHVTSWWPCTLAFLCSFLNLALLLGCKSPHPAQSVQGQVLRWGIWQTSGDPIRVPAQDPQSARGRHLTYRPVLLAQTNQIPATRGVRFGFEFELTGLPPGPAQFTFVITHPPIREPDGSVVTRSEFPHPTVIPEEGFVVEAIAFGFDHDYELVPGKWTMEIWRDSRKVVERTFEVYEP